MVNRKIPSTAVVLISGRPFCPVTQGFQVISIEDAAWHLAMRCRWSGSVIDHYSVAQHSVFVSQAVGDEDPRLALAGLLHDIDEAPMPDLPRPFYPLFPYWQVVAANVRAANFEHYGLPREWAFSLPPAVQAADDYALARERACLVPPADWFPRNPVMEQGPALQCWSRDLAAERFLRRFRQIQEMMGVAHAG